MSRCVKCGSHAINHLLHGRDGSDDDLCDVCYWRKRAERIKELEALEQQRIKSLSAAYVTIANVSTQLTAERAISDKLEKALAEVAQSLWGQGLCGAGRKAESALAEVAAIRAKENGDE